MCPAVAHLGKGFLVVARWSEVFRLQDEAAVALTESASATTTDPPFLIFSIAYMPGSGRADKAAVFEIGSISSETQGNVQNRKVIPKQ
jgi:hypothetical protein